MLPKCLLLQDVGAEKGPVTHSVAENASDNPADPVGCPSVSIRAKLWSSTGHEDFGLL